MSPSIERSETAPYYYVFVYEGTDVTAAQATTNYATYGAIYNWPAVMTEGICPYTLKESAKKHSERVKKCFMISHLNTQG